MNVHTSKAFETEMAQLRGLIAEMGGLAEGAIARAMLALQRADHAGATLVREDDRRIDTLAAEVERLAVQTIALRAPLAVDLREVVAALKIAGVVERIGDYAKNIAKRVPLIAAVDGGDQRIEPVSTLPAMARMAAAMVRNALDAFAARDADAAARVRDSDGALDDFYDSIFRTLVTYMVENPRTITQVAHLLFVAKNLERIGDHATNVAEMVYFAATGSRLAERNRKEP